MTTTRIGNDAKLHVDRQAGQLDAVWRTGADLLGFLGGMGGEMEEWGVGVVVGAGEQWRKSRPKMSQDQVFAGPSRDVDDTRTVEGVSVVRLAPSDLGTSPHVSKDFSFLISRIGPNGQGTAPKQFGHSVSGQVQRFQISPRRQRFEWGMCLAMGDPPEEVEPAGFVASQSLQ